VAAEAVGVAANSASDAIKSVAIRFMASTYLELSGYWLCET
jgi:hypothetical protein